MSRSLPSDFNFWPSIGFRPALREEFGFYRRVRLKAGLACFFVTVGFLAAFAPPAHAQSMKLEVQLLWGTNDAKSPDKDQKPVDADIEKKLKDGPYKWSHYFVVNRKQFNVPSSGSQKVALSDKCEIEVKSLGHDIIEVTHFGQGKKTWQGKQGLPKGETLILAGNAPSATSWLVVLKRIE